MSCSGLSTQPLQCITAPLNVISSHSPAFLLVLSLPDSHRNSSPNTQTTTFLDHLFQLVSPFMMLLSEKLMQII